MQSERNEGEKCPIIIMSNTFQQLQVTQPLSTTASPVPTKKLSGPTNSWNKVVLWKQRTSWLHIPAFDSIRKGCRSLTVILQPWNENSNWAAALVRFLSLNSFGQAGSNRSRFPMRNTLKSVRQPLPNGQLVSQSVNQYQQPGHSTISDWDRPINPSICSYFVSSYLSRVQGSRFSCVLGSCSLTDVVVSCLNNHLLYIGSSLK